MPDFSLGRRLDGRLASIAAIAALGSPGPVSRQVAGNPVTAAVPLLFGGLGEPVYRLALGGCASIAISTTFDLRQAGERTWITRLATSSFVFAPNAAMCGAAACASSAATLSHFSTTTTVDRKSTR